MSEVHIPSLGARESKHDPRTVKHEEMTTLAVPPDITGGYDYLPTDIEHQHKVGICTAISLTQNAAKALGRKFSADFQYLLQKKYYDGDWTEGSSIFNALKVGLNYGFLPVELWTYTTEADRNLPYNEYIAKLKEVSDSDVHSLILQCVDYRLTGYASVDVTDPIALTKAISDSKAGVLCRYSVGKEWYTAQDGRISWATADIDPLRAPVEANSGHAITLAKYDFSNLLNGVVANTWGATWNKEGLGDIVWDNYKPTEAWIPYYGLTEDQTQELKSKLQTEISLLQKIINLWIELKSRLVT